MSKETSLEITNHFQSINKDLLQIQKKIYSIDPSLDLLINTLEKDILYAREYQATNILYKLNLLRNHLVSFKNKQTNFPQDTIDIAQQILSILPDEIDCFTGSLETSRNKGPIFNKHNIDALNKEPLIRKLLMVQYDNIGYLIPIHERIWEQFVIVDSNANNVRIQINQNQGSVYIFETIAQSFIQNSRPEVSKKAILIRNEIDKIQGIIVDTVHGILYIRSQLLEHKLHKLVINDYLSKYYMQIKGTRYFLKDISNRSINI